MDKMPLEKGIFTVHMLLILFKEGYEECIFPQYCDKIVLWKQFSSLIINTSEEQLHFALNAVKHFFQTFDDRKWNILELHYIRVWLQNL